MYCKALFIALSEITFFKSSRRFSLSFFIFPP